MTSTHEQPKKWSLPSGWTPTIGAVLLACFAFAGPVDAAPTPSASTTPKRPEPDPRAAAAKSLGSVSAAELGQGTEGAEVGGREPARASSETDERFANTPPGYVPSEIPRLGGDEELRTDGEGWRSEGLEEDREGVGSMLLRMFLVLGLVLAVVYIVLNHGLRRLMGFGNGSARGKLVSVVERIPLDAKRALFVIRAGDEVLLVGGGEGNLSLIQKLDPAQLERLETERAAVAQPASAMLQRLLDRRAAPLPPGSPSGQ